MKERTRNIAVGLTALGGLAGLLLMMVLFGYLPKWLDRGYDVQLRLQHAGGLNEASLVWFNGIAIGTVNAVKLQQLPATGVQAQLRINREVRLPRNSRVRVSTPMFGGSPSVAIDVANLSEPELLDLVPTDGTGSLEMIGEVPSLTGEVRSALTDALKQFKEEFGSVRGQLDEAMTKFSALSDEWVKVGQNVNELLVKRTPDQVDAGQGAGNVSTLIQRADQRLGEMKATLASINKLVEDDTLLADLRATLKNTREASEKVNAGAGQITALSTDAQQLIKRYVAVADDLSATLDSTRKLIDQARAGQGTMGKLVSDPALYDNLNDTVQRLGKAVDEAKLLFEKWKKEGLPIQF